MASNQTEHCGLNQWAGEDSFLRSEFNEDNRRVDEALNRKCEMAWGTYTGNGQARRWIELGFTPAVLITADRQGHMGDGGAVYGGVAMPGLPVTHYPTVGVEIQENGFWVGYDFSTSLRTNTENTVYYYLAIL